MNQIDWENELLYFAEYEVGHSGGGGGVIGRKRFAVTRNFFYIQHTKAISGKLKEYSRVIACFISFASLQCNLTVQMFQNFT